MTAAAATSIAPLATCSPDTSAVPAELRGWGTCIRSFARTVAGVLEPSVAGVLVLDLVTTQLVPPFRALTPC
jgi:hypothetical protein